MPARSRVGHAVLNRATRARDVSASCDNCTIVAVISSAAAAFEVAIERSCDMLPSSWVMLACCCSTAAAGMDHLRRLLGLVGDAVHGVAHDLGRGLALVRLR